MARLIAIIIGTLLMTSVAAMGLEPMTATIRVSSGSLYDYVIIAEHPKGTDGFDNAYDTISPGNLNADMGEPFISVVVRHPEWKPAREMRGDVRSLAARKEWEISITSSLAKGTPFVVAIQPDQSSIPKAAKVSLKDQKKDVDLTGADYTVPAPGPGITSRLVIQFEQP